MQLTIILVSNALFGIAGHFLNTSNISQTIISIAGFLITIFYIAEGFYFYKVRKRYLLLLPLLSTTTAFIAALFIFPSIYNSFFSVAIDLLYGGTKIYSLCAMPLFYAGKSLAVRIICEVSLFIPWLLLMCGITLGRKVNKKKYLEHLESKNYKQLTFVSRITLHSIPLIVFNAAFFTACYSFPSYKSDYTSFVFLFTAINLIFFMLFIQPFSGTFLSIGVINKKSSFVIALSALLLVELELYIIALINPDIIEMPALLAITGVRILLFLTSYSIAFSRNKKAGNMTDNTNSSYPVDGYN